MTDGGRVTPVPCRDDWHWKTGEPYQCPACGYWVGEGFIAAYVPEAESDSAVTLRDDSPRERLARILYEDYYEWGVGPFDDLDAAEQEMWRVNADEILATLGLDRIRALAVSWHQGYDSIPANDPRNPSDADIAYDDAGFQILHILDPEKYPG